MSQNPQKQTSQSKRIGRLAVATAVLPILATHLAYAVAIAFDMVPACIPYIEGCTSISSTGRTNPSQWVFKPLMLVSAVAMTMFFIGIGRPSRLGQPDSLAVCGTIGAIALVLYLLFLGSEGDVYRLLRRYGVSLYFGFVFLGQLIFARRIARVEAARIAARGMLGVSAVMLIMGIGSIPITNFVADKDQIENVIEWNFALLLQLNFLLAWRAWKAANRPVTGHSDQAS
ncbi:MAG: hypothetical protein HKN59_02550 [Gammaproteobacteria bacterium]|nr:hypothetical protein [Gammaproteobacteria bacterium]